MRASDGKLPISLAHVSTLRAERGSARRVRSAILKKKYQVATRRRRSFELFLSKAFWAASRCLESPRLADATSHGSRRRTGHRSPPTRTSVASWSGRPVSEAGTALCVPKLNRPQERVRCHRVAIRPVLSHGIWVLMSRTQTPSVCASKLRLYLFLWLYLFPSREALPQEDHPSKRHRVVRPYVHPGCSVAAKPPAAQLRVARGSPLPPTRIDSKARICMDPCPPCVRPRAQSLAVGCWAAEWCRGVASRKGLNHVTSVEHVASLPLHMKNAPPGVRAEALHDNPPHSTSPWVSPRKARGRVPLPAALPGALGDPLQLVGASPLRSLGPRRRSLQPPSLRFFVALRSPLLSTPFTTCSRPLLHRPVAISPLSAWFAPSAPPPRRKPNQLGRRCHP